MREGGREEVGVGVGGVSNAGLSDRRGGNNNGNLQKAIPAKKERKKERNERKWKENVKNKQHKKVNQ